MISYIQSSFNSLAAESGYSALTHKEHIMNACTFELVNSHFGSNAVGSQLYFGSFEVKRVDISEYSTSGHIWRIFGNSPDGKSYVDCATLYDYEACRMGLQEGTYTR